LSSAGIFVLWSGVLAGPVAWAADLGVGYAMTPWVCGHHNRLPLHLLSLAALVLIGLAAWTSWRALDAEPEPTNAVISSRVLLREQIVERAEFMACLGLGSSALFAVVVIATEIPRWIFDLCR
jgi:hypothetical protein